MSWPYGYNYGPAPYQTGSGGPDHNAFQQPGHWQPNPNVAPGYAPSSYNPGGPSFPQASPGAAPYSGGPGHPHAYSYYSQYPQPPPPPPVPSQPTEDQGTSHHSPAENSTLDPNGRTTIPRKTTAPYDNRPEGTSANGSFYSNKDVDDAIETLTTRLSVRGVESHHLQTLREYVHTLESPNGRNASTEDEAKLDNTLLKYTLLASSFTSPSELDFSIPSGNRVNKSEAGLYPNPRNQSVLKYEQALDGLLGEADAIRPGNNQILRTQKKLALDTILHALRRLKVGVLASALRELEGISATFATLYEQFIFPVVLDFAPGGKLGLASDDKNWPVITYHDGLTDLLGRINILDLPNEAQVQQTRLRERIDLAIIELVNEINTRQNNPMSQKPAPDAAVAKLDELAAMHQRLVASFVFPDALDFSPPRAHDTSELQLAVCAVNSGVLSYYEQLSKIQLRVDQLESQGSADLRCRRKRVTKRIEMSLEEVKMKVNRLRPTK